MTADTLGTAILFLAVVIAIAGIGVAVGMLVARWLDGRVAADDEGSSDDGTDRRPDD